MDQLSIQNIEFNEIKLNAHGLKNGRTYVGDISELTSDISTNGLSDPMVVWKTDQGDYVLTAGYRRHAAVESIREEFPDRFQTLNVSVYDGDLEGAIAQNIRENIHRENLNAADEAEAVFRLYEKVGDQTAVAEMLCKSQPWVSNKVNLYRGVIPQVLEELRAGSMKHTTAKKFSKMLLEDGTPDVEAQTQALERLNAATEEDLEEGEGRSRAKTSRTKKEVEELELMLSNASEDIHVDKQHVASLKAVIAWYRCQIDSEELIFDWEEFIAQSEVTEDSIVEISDGEVSTMKRRIRASGE